MTSKTKRIRTSRGGAKTTEDDLFKMPSSTRLYDICASLPKMDLHRHLTGSIDAATASRIAARFNIVLPSDYPLVAADLERKLFGGSRVRSLSEYFAPWPILNRLFVSKEAVHLIIHRLIAKAKEDGVVYVELRVGPRGFYKHKNDALAMEPFVEALAEAVADGEVKHGVMVRCILGIPRHIFARIENEAERARQFASMMNTVTRFAPRAFVGVDLNGDESVASGRGFESLFRIAGEYGLRTTAHAGEIGGPEHVIEAVKELGVRRIGHGIAAAQSVVAMDLLAEHGVALEICPTSNVYLGLVPSVAKLPLKDFADRGIKFTICTDNPEVCKTSMTDELFKVAQAFCLSQDAVCEIIKRPLQFCFANGDDKRKLESMMAPAIAAVRSLGTSDIEKAPVTGQQAAHDVV